MDLPFSALHTEFIYIYFEKTLSGDQIKRSRNKILATRGKPCFFYLSNSPLNPLTSLVNTSDVGHFDDSLLAIHCIYILEIPKFRLFSLVSVRCGLEEDEIFVDFLFRRFYTCV